MFKIPKKFSLPTFVLFAVITGGVFVSPQGACAADSCPAGVGEENLVNEPPVFIEEIPEYTLEQPLAGIASVSDFGEYIILVYQFGIGLVGIVAVVLIMFGGYRWVTSAGNEQTISSAKETIVAAVSGLIIALLSYSILVLINPELVKLDVAVFQIPKVNQCGFEAPTVVAIPNISGLAGNGHQACPAFVAELKRVVDKMKTDFSTFCQNCTIVVSSGFRTSQRQQELRNCFEAKRDTGTCPASCGTCNPANKPCCSYHEQGRAVDVYLEGVNQNTPLNILESSKGFLKVEYNDGGGNPALAENQKLLQQIMTSTGVITPIPNEWWHFEYKTGSCEVAPSACNGPDGSEAEEAYCVGDPGDGTQVYSKAICKSNQATCPASSVYSWNVVTGGCSDSGSVLRYYSFGGFLYGGTSDVYTTKPTCTEVDPKANPRGPKW